MRAVRCVAGGLALVDGPIRILAASVKIAPTAGRPALITATTTPTGISVTGAAVNILGPIWTTTAIQLQGAGGTATGGI